jgi:hypothetical protein
MEIADFELKRYFARWEFAAAHLLCASDPEPVPMGELLAMADPQTERLWADLRLLAALRPTTRAVVVNFPHSPTGALPPRSTLDALVDIVEQRGAWLVSDEVYRLLELDPAERWPAAVDRSQRALSIGVMSKAFGLGGLRIGWVVCHDRELLGRFAADPDPPVDPARIERARVELARLLGAGEVLDDPLALALYSRDASMIEGACSLVAFPRDREATGAPAVLVANPGCAMQIAAGLAERGTGTRVLHAAELLDQAYARE